MRQADRPAARGRPGGDAPRHAPEAEDRPRTDLADPLDQALSGAAAPSEAELEALRDRRERRP